MFVGCNDMVALTLPNNTPVQNFLGIRMFRNSQLIVSNYLGPNALARG